MPFGWLFWELGILPAALRLARRAAFGRGAATTSEEYFLVAVAADIVLASTVAAIFSFARLNHPAAYLGSAALLGAASLLVPGRRFRSGAGASVLTAHPYVFSCLAVLFLPLFLLAFRPIQDVDSLNIVHFLIEWMNNRLTPYTFGLNWIPFWELGFLPPLILERSDLFFGLVALKSIALVGAGLYLVAIELGIPRRLALVLAASALAFRHYWWEYSGVPTLKTDALHAAGAVLLGLALLRVGRGRSGRFEHVLMALGIAFACVKFSGPVLACFAFLVYAAVARPKWPVLASILTFGLATSGHYYLRSLIAYGNPVYPFAIQFAGLRLPGTAELSNLSILHSLGDGRLWRAFFLPRGGLSPAGLLFPATLAAVLIASTWLTLSALQRRTPRSWFVAFVLAGWLVYSASVYSASSEPGDLAYVLNSLNSLRYVEGVLGLSEIWLVSLVVPASGAAAAAAAILSLASRLWMLYRNVPLDVFPLAVVHGTAFGVGVVLLLVARFRRQFLSGAFAMMLLAAGPAITERNRLHWADWWKEIHGPLRHLPPSSVFLVEDPRAGHAAGHYLLAGAGLRHDVRVGRESELAGAAPRYLARLIMPGEPKPDFAAFASRYGHRGYEPVMRSENGVLLERVGSMRSPREMRGWLLGPEGLPAAGTLVDEGGAAPSTRPLKAGDFALQPATRRLFVLGPPETKRVEPVDGARLMLVNCGPPDPAGRASGLLYEYSGGRWKALAQPPATPGSEPFGSVSKGSARVQHMTDAAGPFQRISATEETDWLVLARSFPKLPDHFPVTIRARLRCPDAGKCYAGVTGPRTIETLSNAAGVWETLTITTRLPRSAEALFAVGRRRSQGGDFVDVRDFELYAGFVPSP